MHRYGDGGMYITFFEAAVAARVARERREISFHGFPKIQMYKPVQRTFDQDYREPSAVSTWPIDGHLSEADFVTAICSEERIVAAATSTTTPIISTAPPIDQQLASKPYPKFTKRKREDDDDGAKESTEPLLEKHAG